MKDNIKIIMALVIFFWVQMIIMDMVNTHNDSQQHNEIKEHLDRIEQSIKPLQEITVRRKGTIATRCNNLGCIRPGNKKLDALAIGYHNTINGKFLVFSTPQDGAYALQLWKEDRPEWTLRKAISVYAPSIENNTPKYIKDMCKALNVTIETKLKDINSMAFIKEISILEGYGV